MLFNSLHYLLFFPVVALLYFRTAHAYRWILLLLASCYFYMAFIPSYILILFALIIIDYSSGLLIEKIRGSKRKIVLVISLISNIAGLAFFKYFNFINENIALLAANAGFAYELTYLDIILPIGLSFHTFQSMAYTIDVYRGEQKAEKHLGYYALYVLFFPQMVAGPIERAHSLLPQLKTNHTFNTDDLWRGCFLISWGLFKKVVIADRLALIVNPVYANPENYNGYELLIATYLFAIQIYCDFSGYTSIARGSARVLGINLIENFNNPYFATGISSFWKRWHMSLSGWFRDYVYIPLGGNRKGVPQWAINILLVFMLSGLWHGARWTFVIWGLLHGLYLLAERFLFRREIFSPTLFRKILSIFITFNLVTFAWIFFRAQRTSDAFLIIRKIFSEPGSAQAILDRYFLFILLPLMAGLLFVEYRKSPEITTFKVQPALYFFIVIMLIILLGQSNKEAFIYFQF